ncbi:MAG: ABC transporter ATP-binding protein [Acidobacteriia bacterium]|nr:ABC transporter ATP-binding protein [Terriglobia bacterium]
MPAAAIEFQRVTKVYKRLFSEERVEALSDVSFEAAAGEVCAFLGPNGAGKTTSIGLLMGFFFADSGSIRVLGCRPGDIRAKAQIGFLPENFAFYKYLTAPKLLELHLALAGRKTARDGRRIGDLLAKVRLNGYEKLKVGKYSRGMVQRLGIAQALLCDPQLVVLDEPTSGLDPAGRKEVLQLLAALKSEGKTVFLSSHILPEVEQICDRVVIIDRGRLVRTGRLNEMLAGGNRVAIVVDQLPVETEQALAAQGAVATRNAHGAAIVVEAARKRETAEALWSAGCDVVSMNPVRDTLEELFLKEVDHRQGAQ